MISLFVGHIQKFWLNFWFGRRSGTHGFVSLFLVFGSSG